MQAILSQHQMQAWDAYTIQHEPISSIQLMERAALACSQWLLNKWSITTEFILLCGQGNNGGDGFAIARHLLEKNHTVHVYAFPEEGSSLDNRINRQLYDELPNSSIHDISTIKNLPANAVIIDALFGTGLNRPLEGEFVKLVQQINELHFTVVSIDVPSGMLIDNFTSSTSIIQATYTLTFQSVKKAFLFSESGSYCGEVQKLEIGLHPQFLNEILVEEQMITKNMVQQLYQTRHKFSHKGTYGHSLIIAGSNDKMGACLLAAKACLRSGTGLLTCLLTEALFPILQTA
ncbi:MAG TPA: NAD(P)H-hydrate epimerase, partial [Chitinophagaceae bacterium]|nr:NAD(P)H-hydrate epimerase [Chitinophagaceae bacterium]